MTSLRSATQSCPDDEALAAFVEGRLARMQVRRMGEHLRSCEACSDIVERYATAWQIDAPLTTVGSEPLVDAAEAPLAPGRSFARFVLLHLAGRGGMADVHAAYDPVLDRRIALKLLHAHDAPDARARMLDEARAIAAIAHPHIVAIYDVGHAHGRDYIAMEFVDGGTLAHWLSAVPRSEAEIVDAFRQAGLGLAAAHAHGVVHRDFKPANALVGTGASARVRVTDFGLARPRGGAGGRAGTPGYVAPEQAEGAPPDPLADQYSFCIALREALGGGAPAITQSDPGLASPVPERGRIASRRIAAVVARGSDPDPRRRFASMTELLAALAPPRRRWIAVVGVSAAALALVPFAVAADPEPCASIDALRADVWSTARLDEARAAFAATALPYADTAWVGARRDMDARVDAWAADAHAACVAGGDPCAERERVRLERTIDQLVLADTTTVTHAGELIAALDDDACRAADDSAAAIDPIERAALLGDLATALALRHAGHQVQARTELQRVIDRARELGDDATRHDAQLELATLLPGFGRVTEAIATLDEVANAALASGDDPTALAALTGLVLLDGAHRSNHAAGRRWERDATAVLARMGDPPAAAAKLAHARGAMQLDAGELEDAVASLRTVLAWNEATHGPDSGSTATALRNLGLALLGADRVDEAGRNLRRALEIRERTLGEGHPDVAACTDILFGVEFELGHEAAAVEYARRSVAIYEAAYGPDHLDTLNARMRLGSALESRDPEAALAAMRDAVEALARVAGEDHPHVATARFNVAQIELRLGRDAEALATARVAYEHMRVIHGEDDERTVGAAIAIGSALRHLRRFDEARPWLVDALAHSQAAPPGRRAAASDALGRLEYDVGDLPRATALFDAGADAWAEAYGPDHREARASRRDADSIRAEMSGKAR